MPVLLLAGLALFFCAIAAGLTGHLPGYRVAGLMGVANGLAGLQAFHDGARFSALFNGAVCALALWFWWRGGGGDDTKRRLRQLSRHFEGARRTAPTTA
ncbi:hypothetical protein LZP81_31005 [Streptomyces parvulus]|uniref:hypothetical protein n=1 Tax=Streptomyces parvulus TaxID=146923 RepID=UPI001E303B8B|nr:hypothetical protein [Streptomyces parvulus]MCC9154867.1 hypothetical protein [Streptomyces parvulus]MCE7691288.1 hypothetical protein [Streptomyces parvulus]